MPPFGFFVRLVERPFAIGTHREIYRGGNSLSLWVALLDLLPDGVDLLRRLQEAQCQWVILAQNAQQKMFNLDLAAAKHAGLVPREENRAPRFFGVFSEHTCGQDIANGTAVGRALSPVNRLLAGSLRFCVAQRLRQPGRADRLSHVSLGVFAD